MLVEQYAKVSRRGVLTRPRVTEWCPRETEWWSGTGVMLRQLTGIKDNQLFFPGIYFQTTGEDPDIERIYRLS